MDNSQKTLKSPLSTKNVINPAHCEECKAKVAGETQKSLAREVLTQIYLIKLHLNQLDHEIYGLEKLMKEIME